MSHLALVRTSTDGRSLAKLKMTLAALQCSLSSESRSSCRLAPPHTDTPQVTAGIITLKYRFKGSCLIHLWKVVICKGLDILGQNFSCIICQVVAYGRFKIKKFKLLALKVVTWLLTGGGNLQEIPNIVICTLVISYYCYAATDSSKR